MASIKDYLYNDLPIPTFRTFIGNDIEDIILTNDKKTIVVILSKKIPQTKINLIITLLTTNKIVKNALKEKYGLSDYTVDIVEVENNELHFNVSLKDVKKFNNVANNINRIVSSIDTYNNMFLSNRNKLYEIYNDIKQIQSKRQMKMFIELGTLDESAELVKLLSEKTLKELFKNENDFHINIDNLPDEIVSDILVKLQENFLVTIDDEDIKDPHKLLKSVISRDIVIRKFVIRYLQSIGFESKLKGKSVRKRRGGGKQ